MSDNKIKLPKGAVLNKEEDIKLPKGAVLNDDSEKKNSTPSDSGVSSLPLGGYKPNYATLLNQEYNRPQDRYEQPVEEPIKQDIPYTPNPKNKVVPIKEGIEIANKELSKKQNLPDATANPNKQLVQNGYEVSIKDGVRVIKPKYEQVSSTPSLPEGQVENAGHSASPYLIGEFGQGAMKGFGDIVKGLSGILKSMDSVLDPKLGVAPREGDKLDDYAMYKLGQSINQKADELFPTNPEARDTFMAKLAGGAGSIIPFVVGGVLGKAFKFGEAVTPALMGATQNAASQYEDAIAHGADEDTAMEVFWQGFGIGSLEGIPIGNWAKRLNGASGNTLNKIIARKLSLGQSAPTSIQEGFQEMSTQILNNASAKTMYDETRNILDGALDAGMIGIVLGKTLDVIAQSIKARKADPNNTPSDLIAIKKAEEFVADKQAKMKDVGENDFVKLDDDSNKVQELKEQKKQLETDLSNPDVPSEIKETLTQKVNEIDTNIESERQQERQVISEQIDKEGKIADMEVMLSNIEAIKDKATPATQEILQPQIDELITNIDTLKQTIPNEQEKTKQAKREEVLTPAQEDKGVVVSTTPNVEPIKQLSTGVNVYYESDKYTVNDNQNNGKVILNIGDMNGEVPIAHIEFDSPSEAVFVAEKLQENEPKGLDSTNQKIEVIINNLREEYQQSIENTDITQLAKDENWTKLDKVIVENALSVKEAEILAKPMAKVLKVIEEDLDAQGYEIGKDYDEGYIRDKQTGEEIELDDLPEPLRKKVEFYGNAINKFEKFKSDFMDDIRKSETENTSELESKLKEIEKLSTAEKTKAEKVIDAIDKLKIDTKNTLNAFGIIPEAWNAALETFKLAIKAGVEISKAVDNLISELKELAKDKKNLVEGESFDENGARTAIENAVGIKSETKGNVKETPKDPTPKPEQKENTKEENTESPKGREKALLNRAYEGVPNEDLKTIIEELGLKYEIESQDKAKKQAIQFVKQVGYDKALDAVRKNMIEDGAAAFVWAEIIDNVERQLESVTDTNIKNQLLETQKELLNEFDIKSRSSGRFISSLARIYRDSLFNYKADYQINKYKSINKGEIPPEIEQKFKDLEKELNRVNEKLKEAENEAEKAREELSIANIKESVDRETKANKSIKQKSKDIANAIRKGKSQRPNIFMSSSPASIVWDSALEIAATTIEVTGNYVQAVQKAVWHVKNSKWYNDLTEDEKKQAESEVRNYINNNNPDVANIEVVDGKIKIPHSLIRQKVKDGITDPNELTKSILEDIKIEYPEVTERQVRDAISNYGKTVNPSKDEIEIKIRKIKRMQRIISSLEDVAQNKRPLRSGLQRDKLDAEERAKVKELREAMKDLPIDEETQSKQLKTALDGVKSRLKNAIEDIERQIETGEKTQKKGTIEYDVEAKELSAERDRLKELRDSIFGKNVLTNEQKIDRVIKGINISISDIEQKIASKDVARKEKTSITSPEIEALREKQKVLRNNLNELKKELGVAEKEKIESVKNRTRKQIQDLERRLREKDYTKKEKKTTKADEELTRLRVEKMRIQDEFIKEQYKNELKNRTFWQKAQDIAVELLNLPRALRATSEMSPVLIQGGVQTINQLVRNPKKLIAAFSEMGKGFWSEKNSDKWLHNLQSQPYYAVMEDAGLKLTKPNAKITAREELYLSGLLTNIWGAIGIPLKLLGKTPYENWEALNLPEKFERAGIGYLNSLRVSRFLQGMRALELEGKNPQDNPQEYKALAKVINTLTGRSSLGAAEQIVKPLSLLFFSPRNTISNIKQVTLLPMLIEGRNKDGKFSPSVAQKVAVTDFFIYMGAMTTIVAMIKNAYKDDKDKNAPKVETDPRSSDFMTIKVGDTRIDLFGGKRQYVILASRLITDATINGAGKEEKLGSGPFIATPSALLYRTLIKNKLSPSASILEKYLTSPTKKIDGEYVRVDEFTKLPLGNPLNQIANNLYPIYFETIKDVHKEHPEETALFFDALGFWGIGFNTYGKKDNKKDSKIITER